MTSETSSIRRQVRRVDRLLEGKAEKHYASILKEFVKAFPLDTQNKVNGLLQAKDYVSLLEWADALSPHLEANGGGAEHATVKSFYLTSQLVALIKKYPFRDPTMKPKATSRAISEFHTAEHRCMRYNLKFLREFDSSRKSRFREILYRISSDIRYILGDEPRLSQIYDKCYFGPGASVGIHGNSTNLARKLLSKQWTCTPTALPYAISSLLQDQHIIELVIGDGVKPVCLDADHFRKEVQAKIRLVHYNKIVTVPKTAKVDRTIAVEPLLNGYLQSGVDVFMRQRLKRIGIDLTDQGRNQNLARLGSSQTDDPFITIDLSQASDSISSGLARRVLPPSWYHFLDAIRSPAYVLNGSNAKRYHKFVSMGNGFCFPLETLIFASVCRLYCHSSSDYSVYGDDIIVRQSVAHQVISTLRAIGFRHNPRKTFLEGPFRESCGADWYAGHDVRPLTLDYELSNVSSIIKFYNMSLSKPFWACHFEGVRDYLFNAVPESARLCRPYKGNVYGAFEVPLDMFQSSPFSRWNREVQAWSWVEIDLKGVPDRDVNKDMRYSTALVMAAVRGSPSRMPFARRRETSQSVRRKTYAGAESTWLPPL